MHRVVIESSLREITGSKDYSLNIMRLKYTDVIMNANKVIPENLVYVRQTLRNLAI